MNDFGMQLSQRLADEATSSGGMDRYDIFVVNDAQHLTDLAEDLALAISEDHSDFLAGGVSSHRSCMLYLESLEGTTEKAPSAFLLDSCDVGVNTAVEIERWFTANRPDDPLPYILMCSTVTTLSVRDANEYKLCNGKAPTNVTSEAELIYLRSFFRGEKRDFDKLGENGLRTVLADRFGLETPETPKEKLTELFDYKEKDVLRYAVRGLRRETLTPLEMSDITVPVARSKVEALKDVYANGAETVTTESGRAADAKFYDATGGEISGEVCFTLGQVVNNARDYKKSVLVMQSYDPEVIPYLGKGDLSGVVMLSPYMAAHIKLLCEANGVSGVFGMVPEGLDKLSAKFDEFAQPDLPPFIEERVAKIGDHTVKEGDGIILGLAENGIAVVKADHLEEDELYKELRYPDNEDEFEAQEGLDEFNNALGSFLAEVNAPGIALKVNVDTNGNSLLDSFPAAGLVRTEQLATSHAPVAVAVRDYFLQRGQGLETLKARLTEQYVRTIDHFDDYEDTPNAPVKFRLFDFSFDELFNAQDLKTFRELYNGRKEVRGMAAVDTWRDLYEVQIEAMLEAQSNKSKSNVFPIEIMMPAMRTEEEVRAVKDVVMSKVAAHDPRLAEHVSFGVMIETTRSCMEIEGIAEQVDFISFGTNDLTQDYTGIARGDLLARKKFIAERGFNPFAELAPEIQELMSEVVTKARAANPDIRVDVCGAQAADVEMIPVFEEMGIDAISVAPNKQNLYVLGTALNLRRLQIYKQAMNDPAYGIVDNNEEGTQQRPLRRPAP